MENLIELTLNNISVRCTPSMFNITTMRDEVNAFSHTLRSGHVYGVISKPGQGAWALSYLLAGKVKKYTGIMSVNGTAIVPRWFLSHSMYVGEGLRLTRWLTARNQTIRQQLIAGQSNYSVDELVELLELTLSRLDRSFRYISNERWNASVAIGLAHKRDLYCFPWFDFNFKSLNRERLKHCVAILKAHHKITIIPSDDPMYLENVADEFIFL